MNATPGHQVGPGRDHQDIPNVGEEVLRTWMKEA